MKTIVHGCVLFNFCVHLVIKLSILLAKYRISGFIGELNARKINQKSLSINFNLASH